MESLQGLVEIELLHFNDVYNIEDRQEKREVEEQKGVEAEYEYNPITARFVTAMKKYDCVNKIVSFGGDLFSPSLMSYLY